MSIFTAKPNLKKSLALLALAPLVLTGCVSTASDGENGEVNLINNGVLTVCTNTPLHALRIRRKRKNRRYR